LPQVVESAQQIRGDIGSMKISHAFVTVRERAMHVSLPVRDEHAFVAAPVFGRGATKLEETTQAQRQIDQPVNVVEER